MEEFNENEHSPSNQHRAPQAHQSNQSTTKMIAVIALVIVVGIGSFVGGIQFQKGKATSTSAQGMNSAQFGRNGERRLGGIGTVTAVSATSITIQEMTGGPDSSSTTGTTKTYTIDSSTKITDNGATVAYSDIAVGNRVLVRSASSTSTTATEITVNPSFGGGMGGASQTSADNSGQTLTTTTN